MTMIIKPGHATVRDVFSLLQALPPKFLETVGDWCKRTDTELEGDSKCLYYLFDEAVQLLEDRRWYVEYPSVDWDMESVAGTVFKYEYRCECSCKCTRTFRGNYTYCSDCSAGDC